MSYIEAISLLHLLHKVPAAPSTNLPPTTPVYPSESYSLPLEKERSLAAGLAFLCGIFLDAFYVPALYIHENVTGESLKVFVAINRKNEGTKETVLQDIKQKLQTVLSVLSSSDQENNENDIMNAIVTMCEERIKDRLELSKPMDKSFQKVLQIMLSARGSTKEIKTNTRQLIARMDEYKKHQTIQQIVPIIDGAKTLSLTPKLEAHVDKIPNTILDPGQRKKICRTLRKVAQYRETARLLYRTAKKFKAARNMEVVAVDLPPETFTFEERTTEDLESTLIRTQALSRHARDYVRLMRRIGYQNSSGQLLSPEDYFANWCAKSQRSGKVHSEVQLIAYYEQHRIRPPPRVICASKKACFLCNALIKLHAKFNTPTCHGRLYPGWKLPRSIELDAQFARVLEDLARTSIRRILSQNRLIKFPDPIESSVFTKNSSKTTVHFQELDEQRDIDVAEAEPGGQPQLSSAETGKEESAVEIHEITVTSSPEVQEDAATSHVVADIELPCPKRSPIRLERGKPQNAIVAYGSTLKFSSGVVNFHIEYESQSDKTDIRCQVEWLAEKPSDGSDVIDVHSLRGELPVGEDICISSKNEYFAIKIQ